MTDRQQLLRHISLLTDHPHLGKHLKQYQGLDYSTFTDKQLQDIIKKMEDLPSTSVPSTLHDNTVSEWDKLGPMLIDMCNPYVEMLRIRKECGYRLTPWESLIVTVIGGIVQCHTYNTSNDTP